MLLLVMLEREEGDVVDKLIKLSCNDVGILAGYGRKLHA